MTEVDRVREIFDEVIVAGQGTIPRFGKFHRDQVAILFAEIDRLQEDLESCEKALAFFVGPTPLMGRNDK